MNAIGHEYTEVFKIIGAWTPWFYDVAWDPSFVIFNRPQMKFWILCMTDTD